MGCKALYFSEQLKSECVGFELFINLALLRAVPFAQSCWASHSAGFAVTCSALQWCWSRIGPGSRDASLGGRQAVSDVSLPLSTGSCQLKGTARNAAAGPEWLWVCGVPSGKLSEHSERGLGPRGDQRWGTAVCLYVLSYIIRGEQGWPWREIMRGNQFALSDMV